MRDRRQVGLVDHSDQLEAKINRAVEEGALQTYLSLARLMLQKCLRKPTYFGKARKIGRHTLVYLLKQLLKADRIR
jgi:hypothetical protein